MGAGDALQAVQIRPDETLYVAQADVENCFYQCALPPWLCPYFALARVPVGRARAAGITTYVDGA
eukprot:9324481-Lingulodinium_polyedra.AAC.1